MSEPRAHVASAERFHRGERWGLVYLPLGILVLCLLEICAALGTFWPWGSVVHEDGRRTLLGTVFYFEHGARELPLNLVLGLAVGGSAAFHSSGPDLFARDRRLTVRLAVLAAAIAGVIFAGAFGTVGTSGVWENLLQLHTRAGAPPTWGSHWRYHLLERPAVMLLGFALLGTCCGTREAHHRRTGAVAWSFFLFASLTAFFGVTAEPFTDARFLGHQARELVTHASVTVPLSVAACLALIRRGGAKPPAAPRPRAPWPTRSAWAICTCLGAFLVGGALLTHAPRVAQTSSVTSLVFVHYFEHILDYALVSAVAALAFILRTKHAEGRRPGDRLR